MTRDYLSDETLEGACPDTLKALSISQKVLDEVLTERMHQDDKWGGPEHDDKHSTMDFLGFIRLKENQAVSSDVLYDKPNTRRRLLQISALAVAAIERLDRE